MVSIVPAAPDGTAGRSPFLWPVWPRLPFYEPVRGLEITSKTGPPIARVSKSSLIRRLRPGRSARVSSTTESCPSASPASTRGSSSGLAARCESCGSSRAGTSVFTPGDSRFARSGGLAAEGGGTSQISASVRWLPANTWGPTDATVPAESCRTAGVVRCLGRSLGLCRWASTSCSGGTGSLRAHQQTRGGYRPARAGPCGLRRAWRKRTLGAG